MLHITFPLRPLFKKKQKAKNKFPTCVLGHLVTHYSRRTFHAQSSWRWNFWASGQENGLAKWGYRITLSEKGTTQYKLLDLPSLYFGRIGTTQKNPKRYNWQNIKEATYKINTVRWAMHDN